MTTGRQLQALLAEIAGDDRGQLERLVYESVPVDLRTFSPLRPAAPVVHLDVPRAAIASNRPRPDVESITA